MTTIIGSRQLFCCMQMLAILTVCLLSPSLSTAAQTSNHFNVLVNTIGTGNNKPISNSAFCRSTIAGVNVTVVCKTGAFVDIEAIGSGAPWKPIHGGAYRFITQFTTSSDYRDTISSNGIGTVTSWRTINLHDRDYLELLIGW